MHLKLHIELVCIKNNRQSVENGYEDYFSDPKALRELFKGTHTRNAVYSELLLARRRCSFIRKCEGPVEEAGGTCHP